MTQSRPLGRMHGVCGMLLGSTLALGYAPGVLAERAASSNAIEEVIVSAQRRQESIQDVPIAVSAFSGTMLEDRQIINTSDLQMNTPNVSFTSTNFGGSNLSIRGIGNLVISSSADPGVSIHLNEIAVGTNLNSAEFYDMQRVEVLRVPQGTLFGRNATGGVVNYVTERPKMETTEGFVDFEACAYDHQRIKAAFNLPLGDRMAVRWDYYWQDDIFAREFNSAADFIGSWDQHNLSLIYESFDGNWQARAWVRNIQDSNNITGHYLTSDTSGFYRNYFLTEPRIWGASIRYTMGAN